MEKQPFFRAAMAGLGKYYMGGYGRIGVYRVNGEHCRLTGPSPYIIMSNSNANPKKRV